jgi:hypothetical protein
MKKLEVLLIVVLGGFIATFLFLSRDYSSTAAFFPRVIGTASLIFLVLNRMVSGPSTLTRRPSRNATTLSPGRGIVLKIVPLPLGEGRAERRVRVEGPLTVHPWIPIVALQGGYLVSIYLLGFFVATLAYLIIAPIQLRYERRGVTIATSVAVTLLLAGSFMWLFDIQLPPGAIWGLL